MKKLAGLLNPFPFGEQNRHPVIISLIFTLVVASLFEYVSFIIFKNPTTANSYLALILLGLVVYIAFRGGLEAGIISVLLSTAYLLYRVWDKHIPPHFPNNGLQGVIIYGLILLCIASLVGWLKDRIDDLLISERAARKSAEDEQARLETIIKQTPIGILIADTDGKITNSNQRIEQIMGGKIKAGLSAQEYFAKSIFVTPEEIKPEEWPISQALRQGKPVSAREFEFINGVNKKRTYLQVNASPIRNKSRKVIAAVSAVYDVTEQREIENRKDEFISMASHELKTPVTSMKLYAKILEEFVKTGDSAKAQSIINKISDQINKLSELTNDLLDVARIQTGKLRFHRTPFELDQLLQEIVQDLQETTKIHQIKILETTHITVNADRFRIYQVLTNLLTNAIKYSPQGGEIVIRLIKTPKRATISVKDSGIGISKSQHKKIFNRLYQVTDPDEKTFPGLGMGLYISREIIRRHGGKIWVESEKGKGSTFLFSLPLKST